MAVNSETPSTHERERERKRYVEKIEPNKEGVYERLLPFLKSLKTHGTP